MPLSEEGSGRGEQELVRRIVLLFELGYDDDVVDQSRDAFARVCLKMTYRGPDKSEVE